MATTDTGSHLHPTLSPRRTLRVMLAAAAVVTLAMIAGELSRNFAADDHRPVVRFLRVLRRNFSPSGEQTVGTWLTAGTLLECGLLLFAIAAAVRAGGGRFAGHWQGLAWIFVYLSCDDIVGLHEQVGDRVRDEVSTGGPLLWAWVIPYGVFAAAVAIASVPFLRHLPRDSRVRFLIAGTLFVGGALILEMVEAWIVDARGRGGGPVSVLAIVEETAELLGAIVFLYALLDYFGAQYQDRIVVEVEEPANIRGPAQPTTERVPAAEPGD